MVTQSIYFGQLTSNCSYLDSSNHGSQILVTEGPFGASAINGFGGPALTGFFRTFSLTARTRLPQGYHIMIAGGQGEMPKFGALASIWSPIHDVGAGGLSSALPELVVHNSGLNANVEICDVLIADLSSLSMDI